MYAPNLAEVLPQLPNIEIAVQVRDDSDNELLKGAGFYDDFIQDQLPRDLGDCSEDDPFMCSTPVELRVCPRGCFGETQTSS